MAGGNIVYKTRYCFVFFFFLPRIAFEPTHYGSEFILLALLVHSLTLGNENVLSLMIIFTNLHLT